LKRLAAIGGAVAVVVAGVARSQPPAEPVILYRHAAVLDVETGKWLRDTNILVRGERIASVYPDRDLVRAKTWEHEVDLTGRFVIPGLIDSHEHLATPPNETQAKANMRRDLFGGVTAIRDMADDLRSVNDLAREARLGETPGPDIYSAALMAGPSFFVDPRTHAAARGVEAGNVPWMQAVTPDTDLPLAVARAKGTFATAVKVYANLPGPMVAKITAEAHRQGMKVWAHSAVMPATPAEVIAAGVDVISHSCYMAYQVQGVPASYQARVPVKPEPFANGDNPVMAGLFAQMLKRGTILDATGRVYVEDVKRAAQTGRTPLCRIETAAAITRQAWKAGVPISTGTDGMAAWDDPWPALHDELQFQQRDVGMPPAQVLGNATLVGARAAGQEKDMGSIAPGKLANFVVLAKDPLLDVSNVRSIEMTVKRGRAYARADYRPITKDEFRDAP
jgi:imidazolonepropionase-like amidohydrolase